jgi:hypothetical protein
LFLQADNGIRTKIKEDKILTGILLELIAKEQTILVVANVTNFILKNNSNKITAFPLLKTIQFHFIKGTKASFCKLVLCLISNQLYKISQYK